jgi:hypothetical protein
MGVFVACVPAFTPLLKRFGQKITSASKSGSKTRSQNQSKRFTGGGSALKSGSGTPRNVFSERRESKSLAKTTIIREEERSGDDDEIALCDILWDRDQDWQAGGYAHSRSQICAANVSSGDGRGTPVPDRTSSENGQDGILIVREISVLRKASGRSG